MVLSLAVFVVVSLLAFLVALLFVDGVAWPAVIGVLCGFAAAMVPSTSLAHRLRLAERFDLTPQG